MRICIVGTGYVGLVSGACLADAGNTVHCVDRNEQKIVALKDGKIPIYEPGLEEIVKRNLAEGRMFFATDLSTALSASEICFIAVDTPLGKNNSPDISNVMTAAEQIGKTLDHPAIVVTKSTVPVGTTFRVKEIIMRGLKNRGLDPACFISIASNPEFLKEGSAMDDFMKPDRVIVGVETNEVAQKLHELYSPFMRRQDRFIRMSIPSAELSKYAANAMLATRISFMNEMALFCEKVGADIFDVRRVLASDPRIGPDFLYAGLGYGGSCLPKDAKAIVQMADDCGIKLSVIKSADEANDFQREWFWNKLSAHFASAGGLKKRLIAVWGLAFKANTDDVRFSPALYLIEKLLDAGARVTAFDPAAGPSCKSALVERAENIRFTDRAYEALEGADALVISTEWREFRSPDLARVKALMRSPVIFDGRNLYDPKVIRDMGFSYFGVGRGGST